MDNAVEAVLEKVHWVLRCSLEHRWLAVGTAALVLLLGGLVGSVVPDRYKASARVYVDTQTVLKSLMVGLTHQPDIDTQVRMLASTLISRPNMERLLDMPGLNLPEAMSREAKVTRLMNQIKVTTANAGNLYEISCRDTSPAQAQRLVAATVDLFVHAGSGAKKRDSEDAGRFIEAQIRDYEAKLVEAENRLKEFKTRNFGVSGVSHEDFFARMSALSEQVDKLKVEVHAAEQAREAYRRELAAEEPQLPPELAARAGLSGMPESRLEAQRRVLDDLLQKYTPRHPDVIAARASLAQLENEERRRKESDSRRGVSGRAATSPVYQRLRIALAETEAQLASQRSQLAAHQARLDEIREAAGRVPQVEAELAQLNRDYDILRKSHAQMVERREAASLGVKLDESSQLAEFRLIEPPRVSDSAVFPSRLHLGLITLFLAVAAGVGAAVAADVIRPTFDNAGALQLFSGRPVLGAVPLLGTPQSEQLARAGLVRLGVAVAALLAFQATWLAWLAFRAPH